MIVAFVAGTLVLTANGCAAIESIEESDQVWSYDVADSEWALKRVVKTFTHDYESDLLTIHAAGESVVATGNHPFWVKSGRDLAQRPATEHVPAEECVRLDSAGGRWVDARYLRVGELLVICFSAPPTHESTVGVGWWGFNSF